MCSLIFSRVFRCLVCLLLVCCVLINISPIRTYAVAIATTGSVVGISAVAAVTGILACLGIAYIGYTGFDEPFGSTKYQAVKAYISLLGGIDS